MFEILLQHISGNINFIIIVTILPVTTYYCKGNCRVPPPLHCFIRIKTTDCKAISQIHISRIYMNTFNSVFVHTTEQHARDCQVSLIFRFFWPPYICSRLLLPPPHRYLGLLSALATVTLMTKLSTMTVFSAELELGCVIDPGFG